MRAPLLDRFEDKFTPEPNSGCWLWLGCLDRKGYARMWVDEQRRNVGAHVVALELLRGPIPEGLEIDHKCRVRCCVNPDHLEPVTHLENLRRGRSGTHARSRTHCQKGHAYTSENTVWVKRGWRYCRICRLETDKRYRERRTDREPSPL